MNDTLLITAGIIGAIVAIVHGVLVQRLMVSPLLQSPYGQSMAVQTRKLIPFLMHFATLFWLVGGICLILAPFYFSQSVRMTTSIVVASFYIVGAIGNFWGTRGRHPGWLLLAISVLLIIVSNL